MNSKSLWEDIVRTPPSLISTPPALNSGISNQNSQKFGNFSNISDSVLKFLEEDTQKNNFLLRNSQNLKLDSQNIENRSIIVSNIHRSTKEETIKEIFSKFGEISSIDLTDFFKGSVIVQYFDLRAAYLAKQHINATLVDGNILSVTFAPLPSIINYKKPPNNGTISIFNLPKNITDEYLKSKFKEIGEIREIRKIPSHPDQKFIEFWDIRASKKAKSTWNKKYMMGSQINIQFSIPGGFRKSTFILETQKKNI